MVQMQVMFILSSVTLKVICNDFFVVKINCSSSVFNIIKSNLFEY